MPITVRLLTSLLLFLSTSLSSNGPGPFFTEQHIPAIWADFTQDGYQSTSLIRAHEKQERLTDTPIIGLTASETTRDVENMHSAGMDDYVCKPFTFKRVSQKVFEYGRLGNSTAEEELWRFLGGIR